MSTWAKFPLKGSKEYRALVTAMGFAIGLVWVAKEEYENPKWTGIPKATELSIHDLGEWNKQFGPSDVNKWAIPASANEAILQQLAASSEPVPADIPKKKETW